MSADCDQKGKWIGGCRFEPRYDKGPMEVEISGARGANLAGIIDATRRSTYVADVCIRCGKFIDRSGNSSLKEGWQ